MLMIESQLRRKRHLHLHGYCTQRSWLPPCEYVHRARVPPLSLTPCCIVTSLLLEMCFLTGLQFHSQFCGSLHEALLELEHVFLFPVFEHSAAVALTQHDLVPQRVDNLTVAAWRHVQ